MPPEAQISCQRLFESHLPIASHRGMRSLQVGVVPGRLRVDSVKRLAGL